MEIKWYGHSAFLIVSNSGIRIFTDPYGEEFPYKNIDEQAEIVTISHDHFDHNGEEVVKGEPVVIKNSGEFEEKGIKIKGFSSKHDDSGGSERGDNVIFSFEIEDKIVSHLGDLGHFLEQKHLNNLKDVNILLIPVGGHFTINADEAYEICEQIEPEIIIPMHYKTSEVDLPIKEVDKFTDHFSQKSKKI